MNPDRLIKTTTRPRLGMQRRSSRSAIILGVAILVLALSWTCIGATIGDLVWLDSNMDGIQDHAEIGIDNVTVALYNQHRLLVAVTQTANGGRYRFENVTPGQYYLRFLTFPFTYVNRGYDDDLDSDVYPETCRTALFELSSNSDLSWDAGIIFYFPGVVQPADPMFSTPPPVDEDEPENKSDITVTKKANPPSVTAPGGMVTFTVEVTNNGAVPVTLYSLWDDKYGDLNGQGTIRLPQRILPGGTFVGKFQVWVAGTIGELVFNIVHATARDDKNRPMTNSDTALVVIHDSKPNAEQPGPIVNHQKRTDAHFTYILVLPDGTQLRGAVTIPSGHFEYGKPYAMPIPSAPGATIEGREALPGEAAVTFSPPASGDSSKDRSEVSSVIGSTDARVQVTGIQWTYDGKLVGNPITADPDFWGEPQGSKDPCESFAARIETDKSSYSVGEDLTITFYVSEKAQVTLYDHLPNGKIQIMPLGTVEAGTHRLPGPGQSLTITEPAGVETVELRVASESGCTASVRTSFIVVPSGPKRPSWVESCTRQLARASGIEYKEEGGFYPISQSQYVSFMLQELRIYARSTAPSVTAQMKQCASSLLDYMQQASSTEQRNVAQIFVESYYQTRR